jgi:hypothetical protein
MISKVTLTLKSKDTLQVDLHNGHCVAVCVLP